MKKTFKILLSILLISFPLLAFAQYTSDLTTTENGYCIESDHTGSNDCNRVFFGINGIQNLSNGNYWQSTTGTNHWVGFHFNSYKKIAQYTIVNTDSDSTFFITGWHLTALTSSGEVTIDTQSGVTRAIGVMLTYEIQNPIESNQYKLYVDAPGADGILITQIEFKEEVGGGTDSTVTNKYESVFDQQMLFDLSTVEMLICFFFGVGGMIFYFKKPGF